MRESRWVLAGLNQCRSWPISLKVGIQVFCSEHGSGLPDAGSNCPFSVPRMDDISQLPREWTKQHVTEGVRTHVPTPEFPIQLVDAEEIPSRYRQPGCAAMTRQEEAKQIPPINYVPT